MGTRPMAILTLPPSTYPKCNHGESRIGDDAILRCPAPSITTVAAAGAVLNAIRLQSMLGLVSLRRFMGFVLTVRGHVSSRMPVRAASFPRRFLPLFWYLVQGNLWRTPRF